MFKGTIHTYILCALKEDCSRCVKKFIVYNVSFGTIGKVLPGTSNF